MMTAEERSKLAGMLEGLTQRIGVLEGRLAHLDAEDAGQPVAAGRSTS